MEDIKKFLIDNIDNEVTLTIYNKSGLENDITGFLFYQGLSSFQISDSPNHEGFQFMVSDISHISGGDNLILAT